MNLFMNQYSSSIISTPAGTALCGLLSLLIGLILISLIIVGVPKPRSLIM
jgi:hypothetical protein